MRVVFIGFHMPTDQRVDCLAYDIGCSDTFNAFQLNSEKIKLPTPNVYPYNTILYENDGVFHLAQHSLYYIQPFYVALEAVTFIHILR